MAAQVTVVGQWAVPRGRALQLCLVFFGKVERPTGGQAHAGPGHVPCVLPASSSRMPSAVLVSWLFTAGRGPHSFVPTQGSVSR